GTVLVELSRSRLSLALQGHWWASCDRCGQVIRTCSAWGDGGGACCLCFGDDGGDQVGGRRNVLDEVDRFARPDGDDGQVVGGGSHGVGVAGGVVVREHVLAVAPLFEDRVAKGACAVAAR